METRPPVRRLDLEAALNAIGEVLAATCRSNLDTQSQLGRYLSAQMNAADLMTQLQSLDRHAQILADLSRTCQIIAEQIALNGDPGDLDLMTDVGLDVTRQAILAAHSGTQPPQSAGDPIFF